MSRYNNTSTRRINLSRQYKDRKGIITKFNTTTYKEVKEKNSDIYLIAQEGDRLDTLANQIYGSSDLWWFIARVNNLKTMNVSPGTSLRIPASIEDAVGI